MARIGFLELVLSSKERQESLKWNSRIDFFAEAALRV
jgi:hypothetical protein